MKNLYLLIALLFAGYSNAQLPDFPFIDSTSEWVFDGYAAYVDFSNCNGGFAYNHDVITYFIQGDTTIAGNTYYKMFEERIDSSRCAVGNIQWTTTFIRFRKFIREEDHKLYLYNTSEAQDKLFKDYEDIGIGTEFGSACTIGSIDTLYLLHQPYLKYNCDCNDEFIIQGIGTKRYLFANLNCGIGIEGDRKNRCYRKNGFVINVFPESGCISTGDSTLFPLSNARLQFLDYRIFPNPTTGFVTVDFDENLTGNYTISSMEGRRLLSQSFTNVRELTIDFSEFNKGIYLLFLSSEKRRMVPVKILRM